MEQSARFLPLTAALLGALVLSSCATRPVPNLYEVKREIGRYVSSGRYEAEISAVIAQAKQHLEKRVHAELAAGKPAIVLDIDETVLSNVRLLKLNDWTLFLNGPTNAASGPCSLVEWIKLERGEPIAPTLELIRLAQARGVAVFLITARPESLRTATERNLKAAGCSYAGLILKPPRLRVKSEIEYKAPARQKLVEQGYTILLNVGDQQSDLAGGFAERTFKLPNPFYYTP